MGGTKNYNRFFIIFQEEDKGFEIAMDRRPAGYTKIETKNGRCKVSIYAQNLMKEKGPYRCMLFNTDKSPIAFANLGELLIDEMGRGETWWEYNEEDIGGSGIHIDKFNVAAIMSGEKLAPLAGFSGKDKLPWKEKYLETFAKKENVKIEPEAKRSKTEEEQYLEGEAFKKYEDEIKREIEEARNNENTERELTKAENFKEYCDPFLELDEEEYLYKRSEKPKRIRREEIASGNEELLRAYRDKVDELEEEIRRLKGGSHRSSEEKEVVEKNSEAESRVTSFVDDDNFEEATLSAYKDELQEDLESYTSQQFKCSKCHKKDSKKEKYSHKFHEVLDKCEAVDVITSEIRNCKWWKIDLKEEIEVSENELYPYYATVLHLQMAYPYINYIKYIKRCGYYYFGLQYDDEGEVKYVLYGIKGDNILEDQPYKGSTGFKKWLKHKDKPCGFWVMCYNPYTGRVMLPKDSHLTR